MDGPLMSISVHSHGEVVLAAGEEGADDLLDVELGAAHRHPLRQLVPVEGARSVQVDQFERLQMRFWIPVTLTCNNRLCAQQTTQHLALGSVCWRNDRFRT